ncbi:MAG: hypothetical protein ACRDL0_04475 [Thermoleophilaceae bacterium]
MTTKDRLHRLVDDLSPQEAENALRLLNSRRDDPVVRRLDSVAEDDEPFTEDDAAALDEAEQDLAAGRTISGDEIRRKHE